MTPPARMAARLAARVTACLLCSLPLAAGAEAMERSLRPLPRPAGWVVPDPAPPAEAPAAEPPSAEPPSAAPAAPEEPPPPAAAKAPPPVLYPGQDVFALAEFRCGLQADFLRGYWADVVEAGDQPVLRLREHIAVMANHGLTDDQGNPDTTSSHWGDYWCIPQKAWCYGEVKETAFGAKLPRGAEMAWPAADVLILDAGFVPAFAQTMAQRCAVPPEPAPAAAPEPEPASALSPSIGPQ